MTTLEDQINDEITEVAKAIQIAQAEAAKLPGLIERRQQLEAALKALTPRKPRSDKGTKRASAKKPAKHVDANTDPAAEKCFECKGLGNFGHPAVRCAAEGCEVSVCAACLALHNSKWHREAVNA